MNIPTYPPCTEHQYYEKHLIYIQPPHLTTHPTPTDHYPRKERRTRGGQGSYGRYNRCGNSGGGENPREQKHFLFHVNATITPTSNIHTPTRNKHSNIPITWHARITYTYKSTSQHNTYTICIPNHQPFKCHTRTTPSSALTFGQR